MKEMTTGSAIVAALQAHHVDTVFGIPGIQTYELFDAFARESDTIAVVSARHEQACGYMAYGYARSTGRPGVLAVVPGPGVLNAGAALLTAYGASAPVVGLVGDIPLAATGRGFGHLHEMPDQAGTLRTFTKWSGRITHPSQTPDVLAEAFWQATSGRPRPVTVSVPWDVMARSAPVAPSAPRPVVAPAVDETELQRAVELLRDARAPMIVVGSGAQAAGGPIGELAEILAAPVVSFRGGRGVTPSTNPATMSCPEGFEVWPETDVVLAIGSRQELLWGHWPDRPAGLRTINLDIDPEQHARLEPTVAMTADAHDGAAALVAALRGEQPRRSRSAEFTAARERVQARIEASLQPHADYLAVIRDVLPDDGFLVDEVCQVGFTAQFAFPVLRPRTYVSSGSQGTVGFGYPTSLGVKVAHPDKQVVSLSGDGGFLFGASELATAVQHGLGVVSIVFTNNAYGNVLNDQRRLFDGRSSASELQNPDFVGLARSFGADGYRAVDPPELRSALDKALASGRPSVIEVPMPLDPAASPWPFILPPARG